jgi:hypothetical protein
MTIKLDQIILKGQIEKGYDFNEYLDKLKNGINYLTNLKSFQSTKKIEKKYPGIKAEQRNIIAAIKNKEILYVVTDSGIPLGEEMEYPIRTKGYFQKIKQDDILREIKNKKNLKILFEWVGYSIGEDLIE